MDSAAGEYGCCLFISYKSPSSGSRDLPFPGFRAFHVTFPLQENVNRNTDSIHLKTTRSVVVFELSVSGLHQRPRSLEASRTALWLPRGATVSARYNFRAGANIGFSCVQLVEEKSQEKLRALLETVCGRLSQRGDKVPTVCCPPLTLDRPV